MDTNKMRDAFAEFIRRKPRNLRDAYRRAFEAGWHASRETVVVELPAQAEPFEAELGAAPIYTLNGEGRNAAIAECREAIEAQGLKVAP